MTEVSIDKNRILSSLSFNPDTLEKVIAKANLKLKFNMELKR